MIEFICISIVPSLLDAGGRFVQILIRLVFLELFPVVVPAFNSHRWLFFLCCLARNPSLVWFLRARHPPWTAQSNRHQLSSFPAGSCKQNCLLIIVDVGYLTYLLLNLVPLLEKQIFQLTRPGCIDQPTTFHVELALTVLTKFCE